MADKLAARQKVIDVARTFVGSHYLWGSAGATPGFNDGSPHRPGSVTLTRWDKPINYEPRAPFVNAAQCEVAGHYTCAGRFKKVHGGAIVKPDDPGLTKYLDICREAGRDVYVALDDANEWQSLFHKLTPRLIEGDNVADKGKIAWGEDCSFKRHFDCIGFINYVLNKTAKNPYSKGPWSANIPIYYKIAQEVKQGDPAVPGDILFKGDVDTLDFDHIAFLCEDGKVVQAQMAVTGVHADDSYDYGKNISPQTGKSDWIARRRLGDEFFN